MTWFSFSDPHDDVAAFDAELAAEKDVGDVASP
jgi:hypothetical protein